MINAKEIIQARDTYEELKEHFFEYFFEMLQWEMPETNNKSDDYKHAIKDVNIALDHAAKHGFKKI